MTSARLRFALLLGVIVLAGVLLLQKNRKPRSTPKKSKPVVAAPAVVIAPPEVAVKELTVAPGLQVDVWASEPLLMNAVAFCFDEKGRAFIAETARRRSSVPDIRRHDDWRNENLALRSVDDRRAFLRAKYDRPAKKLPGKEAGELSADDRDDWRALEIESERVKLVTDTDGDGTADTASVFAEGFKTLATGTGAGVLANGGRVWFACIPDLWRFDGEKDGAALKRTPLLTGFGVHIAYSGHDMHGTKMGPDGRLYWTIADCGARVTTPEGNVIDNADSGAVFRCQPDGTELELIATGLRNPQSLAFNDVGDLFTGDNNADGGDAARWTHVVEGADYGWRIGWQFLPKLGAWNAEGMWHLDVDRTNHAILPPVAHLGNGPAGIAYYPGTGLPDSYREHFFYANFPGGVLTFTLQPKGASYALVAPEDIGKMTGKLLWELYPSDVQFGVDGGAYVLDWVFGWDKTDKGRIYRVHDPVVDASPLVQETKRLLGEGMEKRDGGELAKLLGHADQRVRQAAQFELVRRGDPSPLVEAALAANPRTMRLHGIWGVAQIARTKPGVAAGLAPLAADGDAEVRAQWAKFVGDTRSKEDADRLLPLLADPEPRVRFFAAQSLGKLGARNAAPALLALLQANDNGDAFIRHAAASALAACADEQTLVAAVGEASDAVRAGILLALRHQHSAAVARFLADQNPQLVLEAARAIHDTPLPAAYPQLALLSDRPDLAAPLARRAINAAYRLGTPAAAESLARCAARADCPDAARVDALEALGQWSENLGRDRVLSVVLPDSAKRDPAAGRQAFATVAEAILRSSPDAVRAAAAEACGTLGQKTSSPALAALLADEKASSPARIAALRALAALNAPELAPSLTLALQSLDRPLVQAARLLSAKTSPQDAVKMNIALLGQGSIAEQQDALAALGYLPEGKADKALVRQLELLLAGNLPPALTLDLLEAAARRTDAAVLKRLALFDERRDPHDPLAKWRECLEGGDARVGRQIFTESAEAGCMRCHRMNGVGGEVGPDLAALAAKQDRTYILQSIVEPNANIAPGYENVLVTLRDGTMVAGLLNAEDTSEVTLASFPDGKKQTIKKADIKERTTAPSVMPPGLADVLGKRALRDVIEYLATPTEPPAAPR